MLTVFKEKVMRIMCAYGHQVRKSDGETDQFIMKWHMSGVYLTLAKQFSIWKFLTDLLRNGLVILRVCVKEME